MDGFRYIEDLEQEELLKVTIDGLRRIFVHYGFWFNETIHQLGFQKACEIEDDVWHKSLSIQMKRLAKRLGFEVDDDGVPNALKGLSKDDLLKLLRDLGVNWLANDGVWFQAIESTEELFTAKRCNDTCWTKFSPYEAFRIKNLLGLPKHGGIPGLKKALSYRMYSRINKQTFEDVNDNVLIFRMVDCRVQSARKRRGLPDYPCKSAGIVEYSTFASSIDTRIKTECIACPPDEHPDDWFCAWKFTLEGE